MLNVSLVCIGQVIAILSLSASEGFKFIGNTALDLVTQGFEVPFGYEEAIGFMFGSEIRDKDGVAATVINFPRFLSIAELCLGQIC